MATTVHYSSFLLLLLLSLLFYNIQVDAEEQQEHRHHHPLLRSYHHHTPPTKLLFPPVHIEEDDDRGNVDDHGTRRRQQQLLQEAGTPVDIEEDKEERDHGTRRQRRQLLNAVTPVDVDLEDKDKEERDDGTELRQLLEAVTLVEVDVEDVEEERDDEERDDDMGRQLLSVTPRYRASYVGEFQHLRDNFCMTEQPVLQAYCIGDITITAVSDPTIQCNPITTNDGWNVVECINTCTTNCGEIYDAQGMSYTDGPFGRIYFKCEGQEVADTDAAFIYQAGEEDGTCLVGGYRSFHVARMGISCPAGSGAGEREYSFDDHYVECSTQYLPEPSDGEGSAEAGHVYTCLTGENCQGSACSIEYEDIVFNMDLPHIDTRCVESLVGPPITDPPTTDPGFTGLAWTAQFMGAWGLLFDDSTGSTCYGDTPTVRMTCPGSTIKFLNATYDSITCSKPADDVLACKDSGKTFVNQFAGVAFECVGPILPKASVEYPPSLAYCDGNEIEAEVSHAVQLGVFCKLDDPIFFFGDYYFDCDDPKDKFAFVDEFGGSDGDFRYTCFQSAVFPPNSLPSQKQVVRLLSISTDPSWESDPYAPCFDLARVTLPPTIAPTTPPPTEPPLPWYQASYVGEFQHLRDSSCLSQQPALQALCIGDITVTNVSDPSIVCTPMQTSDYDGWNMTQCVNTCTTNCRDIYDSTSLYDGPYGQIFFTCEGETVAKTDGAFIYQAGQDGACASGSSRNYHIARMGVSCRLTTGGHEYSFDDHYFECNSGYNALPADAEDGGAGHVYTCVSGDYCQGSACNIEYRDAILNADLPNIDTRCVEPLHGVPITDPPTPTFEPGPWGLKAQFMGAWGLLFDVFTGQDCFGDTPTVRLTCLGSKIKYLNATYDTISCSKVADDVLECTDSGRSFVNQFAGVAFECVGPALPKASIEYPSLQAYCDGNDIEAKVSHAVQLGVFCDFDWSVPGFYFGDYYFDCDDPADQFDFVDEFTSSEGQDVRYTCFQSKVFPPYSVPSQKQVVRQMSISTDSDWESSPDSSCYEVVIWNPETPTPTSTEPPTTPPTQPPTLSTEPPTTPPTQPPTPPTEPPTTPPTEPATATPTAPATEPSTEPPATAPPEPKDGPTNPPKNINRDPSNLDQSSTGGGGSNAAVAAGGAVGAIFFVCLAGFLAIYLKKRHRDNGQQQAAAAITPVVAKEPLPNNIFENRDDSQTGSETWNDSPRPYRPQQQQHVPPQEPYPTPYYIPNLPSPTDDDWSDSRPYTVPPSSRSYQGSTQSNPRESSSDPGRRGQSPSQQQQQHLSPPLAPWQVPTATDDWSGGGGGGSSGRGQPQPPHMIPPAPRDLPPARLPSNNDDDNDNDEEGRDDFDEAVAPPRRYNPPVTFKDQAQSVLVAEPVLVPVQIVEEQFQEGNNNDGGAYSQYSDDHSTLTDRSCGDHTAGTGRSSRRSNQHAEPEGQLGSEM